MNKIEELENKLKEIMKKIYICIHKIITYSHPSGMDRWEYKNSQYDCFKQSTGYFFSSRYISSYLPLSKYQLASSPDSSLFLPPRKNPIVMPLVINW